MTISVTITNEVIAETGEFLRNIILFTKTLSVGEQDIGLQIRVLDIAKNAVIYFVRQ